MLDLIKKAGESELLKFAEVFLGTYGAQGFQALSKRDTDLLLFYTLEASGVLDSRAGNHDVARLLRVTPRRVALLRRDAWARWAEPTDVREHLTFTLRSVFQPAPLERLLRENRGRWKQDGLLPLLLEHPSDRDEVEQFLKSAHSTPHHARNPEVLLVPKDQVVPLLDFAASGLDKARQGAIKKAFASNTKLGEFLTRDISKLSAAEARAVLNNTVGAIFEKASVDLAAKGLSALTLGYLGG